MFNELETRAKREEETATVSSGSTFQAYFPKNKYRFIVHLGKL